MPTTKTRINLTVPADMEQDLRRIAKNRERSVATVTLELLQQALELEEDAALLKIAIQRESASSKWVSHEQAWA